MLTYPCPDLRVWCPGFGLDNWYASRWLATSWAAVAASLHAFAINSSSGEDCRNGELALAICIEIASRTDAMWGPWWPWPDERLMDSAGGGAVTGVCHLRRRLPSWGLQPAWWFGGSCRTSLHCWGCSNQIAHWQSKCWNCRRLDSEHDWNSPAVGSMTQNCATDLFRECVRMSARTQRNKDNTPRTEQIPQRRKSGWRAWGCRGNWSESRKPAGCRNNMDDVVWRAIFDALCLELRNGCHRFVDGFDIEQKRTEPATNSHRICKIKYPTAGGAVAC